MTTTRYDHSADLLPHGLLLIAGSGVCFNTHLTRDDDGCLADIYDPRSDMVKRTVTMSACRFRHTSSVIQIDHSIKVLLAGGYDGASRVPHDNSLTQWARHYCWWMQK
ncbi:unnamed protein product [Rotaria magnacalcarata]|uniref:Uncharacterized protein n=1 Tax=Rotaria magnacalcarata TaxID=392030 RepID=A0A820ALI2_9BILA|nr:unnamed protein product [Rotaria magnacalcarata]CAF4190067.1 unnamed protein product [Rotaria magnacalcarata]